MAVCPTCVPKYSESMFETDETNDCYMAHKQIPSRVFKAVPENNEVLKAFVKQKFIISLPEALNSNPNLYNWKIVKKENSYFLKWSIDKNYLHNFYMPEELRQKNFLGTNLWSPQVCKFEVKIVRYARIVNIESKSVSWIFTTELTTMNNIIYNGFSYNASGCFFISASQENCLLTIDQMDKLVGIFSHSVILDTDTTELDC